MSRFSVETIFKGRDHTSAVIAKIAKSTSGALSKISSSVKTMDSQLSSAMSRMNKVGLATGAATVAAGAGLFSLARVGMDFEHELASLAATAKPTVSELDRLSATAREVGSAFGFSSIDVARSMTAMSKQGMGVEEILAGIGGSAAAAAADGAGLEETTSSLLATMTGLGKKAGDLQRISDVMAKAGDMTAASIGSLSESMSIFGPTAKKFSIPLESAIGQLALLQDAGMGSSSSGTTLAAVYEKLASPMGRNAEAMAKLGISVKDAMGNMKDPAVLMNEILKATSKIKGNVGKGAALTELVGLESQKALSNIVASVESGKFDKVMASLSEGVDGYAASIARAKQNSTTGDINKLTAEFEALNIMLFGIVAGGLRGIIKSIADWTSANKDLMATGFKDALAWLRSALPDIVKWLSRIGKLVVTFYAFAFAVKAINTALVVMKALMATNPWVLAIYALVAAIGLIWAFWPEISAFFESLWRKVTEVFARIGEFLKAAFEIWVGMAVAIWGPIIGAIAGAAQAVIGYFSPLFPFFQWIWGGISSGFTWAWEGIKGIASGAYDFIVQAFEPLRAFFSGLWSSIVETFNSTVGGILDKVSWVAGIAGSIGREAMGDGPQTPSERNAKQVAEANASANVSGEVTVRTSQPAAVTKKPTGGVGLKVQRSGGF